VAGYIGEDLEASPVEIAQRLQCLAFQWSPTISLHQDTPHLIFEKRRIVQSYTLSYFTPSLSPSLPNFCRNLP